jgi:hypothetical protein
MESKQHYTQKQLDVLNLLIKHYRQGVGPDDPEIRRVADSIIDRGTGVVELIDSVETSRRLPAMHTASPTPGPRRFAPCKRGGVRLMPKRLCGFPRCPNYASARGPVQLPPPRERARAFSRETRRRH